MSDPTIDRTTLLDVEPLENELSHVDRELRRAEARHRAAHEGHGPTDVRAAVRRGDVRRLLTRRDQLAYTISRLTVPEAS